MTELNCDFETASQCNLLTEGVYNYAQHPSTEILMMYWAFDDEDVVGWFPGDPWPARIERHLIDGGRINAANAAFERLMWWYVLPKYDAGTLTEPALEQFYCTLYKARCNNMPASLDKLTRALGTFNQKEAAAGKALIKKFCILDENGYSLADGDEDQEAVDAEFDGFCDYCAQDVRAERDAGKMLREPTEEEWQDYWVSERINDRGVRIDRELAVAAVEYAQDEEAALLAQMIEVSNGEVKKLRGEGLKKWVMARLTEEQLELTVKYVKGEKKHYLDKYNRPILLAMDLDPQLHAVLECAELAQKSSVAKFRAMALRAHPQTDRVCGAFMGNGASGTGRYSSKGLQVHNFPRKGPGDYQTLHDDLIEGIMAEDIVDYHGESLLLLLASMLRAAIVPAKNNVLLVSDWSAIEGRVAPWLADSAAGRKKLKLYTDGVDTYIDAAEAIYHTTIEKDDPRRQVGKVAELALQFGGGEGAFIGMGRGMGLTVTKDEAKTIKVAWRLANPWAPRMWDDCENAAWNAFRVPGTMCEAGRVTYFCVEGVLGYDKTLFCQLPCGRVLTYPDVKEEMREAPWGDEILSLTAMKSAYSPKQGETDWPRHAIYGGLLFENIVQATAASLLRRALRRLDKFDYPVVLHVHDEIVMEVPATAEADEMTHQLWAAMNNDLPDWAEGLPLTAAVEEMTVYGK